MNELEERVAKALIDADPTVSGYHETHIAAKLSDARAAIRACGIDDLLARIETLERELQREQMNGIDCPRRVCPRRPSGK